MNVNLIKDKVVIGSLAGTIGSICKDIPNFILYKLGLNRHIYAHLAASAHLFPPDIYSPLGYCIGILADFVTGGAIGVTTLLFLERFGMDYWWFKGLIVGSTIWLFGLGVILNLGTIHLVAKDPLFRLTSLFDHLLFGLVTVFIIYKYQKEKQRRW